MPRKKPALPANVPAPLTDAEITEHLERSARERITDEAVQFAPVALQTLLEICQDSELSAGARVSAARGILEYAVGKPAPTQPEKQDTGMHLHVTINRLTTGEKLDRFLSPTFGAEDVETAVAIAERVTREH